MSIKCVEIVCGANDSRFCWFTVPVEGGDPSKDRTNCAACWTVMQNQNIPKEEIEKILPEKYFILRSSGEQEDDWKVDRDLEYHFNCKDYLITFSKKLPEGVIEKTVRLLKFIDWNGIPIEKFNDYYKPRPKCS
jgi:hypothetical protein